jgi:glutathione S-transferase
MKLLWSPKSPYVRKVMICAQELGLTDRLELVRAVAAMLKPNPDIMRDNPLGKIPTLILDDGSTLFDSRVICEYLNDLGQGSIFPRDGATKWQALRWHAFGDGLLDALILWRNERERVQPLAVLINAFELKTRASLVQLEAEVEALRDAPFCIGHVALCCSLGYLDYRFGSLDWRTLAPRLADWYAIIQERPSIKGTEPHDD